MDNHAQLWTGACGLIEDNVGCSELFTPRQTSYYPHPGVIRPLQSVKDVSYQDDLGFVLAKQADMKVASTGGQQNKRT